MRQKLIVGVNTTWRTVMPLSNPKPSFIERILCRLFPYVDIMRDDSDIIYLRRWFIYPHNKEFKKLEPRIYLHKFYRGDEDPHGHDHPWRFTSLILTRGYWEETWGWPPLPAGTKHKRYHSQEGEQVTAIWYPRFSLLKRPAEWKHRVRLEGTTPVWTLVKTGVRERSWGFWIKDAFCPWRRYNNGICWCEEGPKPESLADQGVLL